MTTNKEHPDGFWDNLFEYFDGECPPSRAAAIEQWIESDPDIARRVTLERASWEELKRAASPMGRASTLASLRRLQARREIIELTGVDPGAGVESSSTRRSKRSRPGLGDRLRAMMARDSTRGVESVRVPPLLQRDQDEPQAVIAARSRKSDAIRPLGRQERLSRLDRFVERTRPMMAAVRVAAALIACVGTVTVGAWAIQHSSRWTPVVRTYATARGQRDTLHLIDGTQVVLAPGSRLLVNAAAKAGARLITLDGEAEMTVVHDPRRPFVVHVNNAVLQDVGTRFVVRGYAGDPDVRVLVTSGVVALGTTTSVRADTLRPGVLGIAARNGTAAVITASHADDYLGWTQGHLVFHLTPLAQVAADVSRWYDLEIVLADSAHGAILISGTLPTNKLDDALSVLAAAAGAHVERHGRTATLITGPPTTGARRVPSIPDTASAHPLPTTH